MDKLHIIKVGGNVIDDEKLLDIFLRNFSAIRGNKLLLHGGGKLATNLAHSLGIEQTLVNGRRITSAETLDITIMVYAGLINKKIVSKLQGWACNAIGLCGADGNLIRGKKRECTDIDFGYVGDICQNGINTGMLSELIKSKQVPTVCSIIHDGKGALLNINADTLAASIAIALKDIFDVNLTYCFEKKGVLKNAADEKSLITKLSKDVHQELKAQAIISSGMIPKLDNAFGALEAGVAKVAICHPESIKTIESQVEGTQLIL